MQQLKVTKVWVDDSKVYAQTSTGEIAYYEFSVWPRLANATQKQREDFNITYFGIHWPQIDEDLNFDCMFSDNGFDSFAVCEDNNQSLNN